MAIGATFSPTDSFAMSTATGEQLKALGINVDDAPVVDTNTNPASTDNGIAVSEDTRAQFEANNLSPCRATIAAGRKCGISRPPLRRSRRCLSAGNRAGACR
jgi:hypothetical protein